MGLMMAAAVTDAAETEPTGAARAWTASDATVVRARNLVERGEFADAERVLEDAADGDRRAQEEMLDVIRRIRWEYGIDDAALLEKVRKSIPDVNADDVARWRNAGVLQHRMIDGQIRYFRREPSNLFRFSDEAKQRRDAHVEKSPSQPGSSQFVLERHVADVIAAAEKTGNPHVAPVRHRVNYTLTIPRDHPLVRPGATVRCWLPYPQEHERQREIKLLGTLPSKHLIAPAGTPQRSVYFEQRIEDGTTPIAFNVRFEYASTAYYPRLDDALAKPLPLAFGGNYLAERPPHIVSSPLLKETVAKIVGNEPNPLKRARKVFEFVHNEIRYCAEEEYGTIPSFTEKALRTRKGDCGIQGMTFIAMCRAAGVPARWQSGWETKPGSWNMHDWAEFYVEPWGWLPADPSYGLRTSDDPKVRHFYFGHQDSYRLIVNLDYGTPLVPPKHSLRSEPADFQRGEVEIDGRNLYFDEWEWEMKFEWEPLGPPDVDVHDATD
jgi:transglutaminase-like putative cysteine protease